MALRAAIFDFDGVIVDSEPLHFRSLREALLSERIEITHAEYWDHLLAYDDRSSIRVAFERRGERPDADRLARVARVKVERFAALIPEIPVFPGAREVIGALAATLPLAIASGARREEIERILRAGGLREAFSAVVGADDVARTKPDPEPYLAAHALIAPHVPGLSPAECLVFEDTIPGIAAGRAAGMKVVGVAQTYPAVKLTLAHQVVSSLDGLGVAEARALFARC
jgi:HAD superfamily hydrolase (TIGR01509 family)